ncbi:Regulator of nonsense transcripts 1-like [Durusdinium trenchii]|uniref:Regulator of nonsense transcripts 1-like n=1 Tax=Durusdinium trenchii TaxID=1381693 RepID=A0ABP0RLM9_9DINO
MDVDETNAWLEELLGFRADGPRAMLGTCCDAGQRPSASEGELHYAMLLRLCWLSWGTWTRVALALGEQSLERFKLSVRCQPRLQELLVLGLGADRRVKLKLPPPSATASKSLQWCKQMVQSILDKGPTVYKIGMTGNPLLRFYKLPSAESPSPGYRYEKDKFEFMYIVFAGATWDEAGLVPCCKVVGLAKALVKDGVGASQSQLIEDLSKIKEKDAEGKTHDVLSKHALTLPIPIREIFGKPELEGFPRLKPIDFLHYMAESGHLNKLLGGRSIAASGRILLQFWQNFKGIHPDFELWDLVEDSDINLADCIPIHAHMDGGRGYKKSEFLVLNWCSIIGNGTGRQNKKDPGVHRLRRNPDSMQTSLLGHSFTSHFLYAAMPAHFHKKNEVAFHSLLASFAEDLRECFDEGIMWNGRLLRLVLVGLKGDAKMQTRAGRFNRNSSTVRKAPYDPTKVKQSLGRCCWLCPAGDIQAPFEEIHHEQPAWWQMMPHFLEPPWGPGQEGGMLESSLQYTMNPAKFYLHDLFHVYLAGVGQDFAAAALVAMLPHMFQSPDSNSVDAQISVLNDAFKAWRKMFHVGCHITAFSKTMLHYPDQTKQFPTGMWSKASDTARIIQFIAYVCSLWPELCSQNKMLGYIDMASRAIGNSMVGLYDADLWIEPLVDSANIFDAHLGFLITYGTKPSTSVCFNFCADQGPAADQNHRTEWDVFFGLLQQASHTCCTKWPASICLPSKNPLFASPVS